jgi:ferredoxin-type protein NapH
MVAMADDKLNVKPGGGKPRSLTARLAAWRSWVQAGFAVIWMNPLLNLRFHSVCSPVFHCYACPWATFACPIGVIAQFSALHVFPFVAVGTLIVFGSLFGGFMCGWVCPFGFLQDLFAKIPTPKFTLPMRAGYLRYVVLVGLVVVGPYLFGEKPVKVAGVDVPVFICRVCPAGALEGAVPNVADAMVNGAANVPWPSTLKLVILGLFLVAVFFVRRPWCTLFCPLGAIFGLFNRVAFFGLRFHDTKCIDCKNCRSMCQYGGTVEDRVDSVTCNRCLAGEKCQAVTLTTVLDRPD